MGPCTHHHPLAQAHKLHIIQPLDHQLNLALGLVELGVRSLRVTSELFDGVRTPLYRRWCHQPLPQTIKSTRQGDEERVGTQRESEEKC
jgi:hypothetical protein